MLLRQLWNFILYRLSLGLFLVGLALILIDEGLFNMLPFLIHQNYLDNVIDEGLFIRMFQILFFVVLMLVVYRFRKAYKKMTDQI